MTKNKEAIETLKIAMAEVEWNYPLDYAVAIETAIEALEKQIPKKPYKDNENGVYEKEYCPTCNRSLFPNEHHCICGQAIDWNKEGNKRLDLMRECGEEVE